MTYNRNNQGLSYQEGFAKIVILNFWIYGSVLSMGNKCMAGSKSDTLGLKE